MSYTLTATLLDSLGIGMCVLDAQTRAVQWNEHFLMFFPEHADHIHVGEPYADNLRRFYLLRLAAEEHVHIDRYIQDGIRRHREQTREYVFVHRGRKLRVAAVPQPNGDNIRVWLDLSNMEASLLNPQAQLAFSALTATSQVPETLRVFDQLSDGVAIHDANGRIVFANDRFVAMYGLRNQQDVLGKTFDALIREHWARRGEEEDQGVAEDLESALKDSMQFSGFPFEIPLPGSRWIRVTMSATTGEQACSCHTDITREKRATAEMYQLTERLRLESHRDALTGLLNRRGLNPLLLDAANSPGDHSLLYIDLDGFKAVNDLAGHAKGDAVLCQVAAVVQASVRGNDSVARMGGDEFVILLRGCDEIQAVAVAQKVVDVVRAREFAVDDRVFRIGASVGVRTFNGGADSTDVFLHDADSACYQAKRQGRGRVVVYGGSPGAEAGAVHS
ncbi:sensor domain-containing diguanylate cyclase [Hydrogenophaga sp. OTU3427]|uniref:sensor domain-containing diguanylate cyclase n=1 Tax=Hydrogenophaga sp. OTU3427 TaxID=3043856 RepID=UPI00313C030D